MHAFVPTAPSTGYIARQPAIRTLVYTQPVATVPAKTDGYSSSATTAGEIQTSASAESPTVRAAPRQEPPPQAIAPPQNVDEQPTPAPLAAPPHSADIAPAEAPPPVHSQRSDLADGAAPEAIGAWPDLTISSDVDASSLSSNTVIVQFDVSETGRPEHVRIKRSSGNSDVDESARKAIESMRFRPAQQGGEPISARMVHEWRIE